VKKSIFTLLFLQIYGIGYAQNIEVRFQEILDSIYQANADCGGIMIHVEVPDKGISWTSAAGYTNIETKEKLDKNQAALIASNTKTYVAAAILKLIENHQLELDEPIKKLVYKKTKKQLKKAGYDISKITVKNLLSHTSGITDYVTDEYFAFVDNHPQHQWWRDEQIDWAMKVADPIDAGKKFAYGDINYLLLTEIIERKTNQPFYQAMRSLLDFNSYNLNSTWFVTLEQTPTTLPLVHQYTSKLKENSYNINPSWDLYGGGGIASTTKDLAMFFQLLFEGKIIQDKHILESMHSYVLPKEESSYGLGIRILDFFGHEAYYHGGFWGTDAIYIPEYNASIAVFTSVKEKRDLNAILTNQIINLLK